MINISKLKADEVVPIKVAVLCRNSEGVPEFFFTIVSVNRHQYDNGDHYDAAEKAAEAEGHPSYDAKLAFDENDLAFRQMFPNDAAIKRAFPSLYVQPADLGYIEAECHSDDRVFKVDFNAAAWFAQASEEDILTLAEIGWGGDDLAADRVAHFMAGKDDDVSKMFSYIELIASCVRDGGELGFECNVDEAQALSWLKEHRPEVHAQLTTASLKP